MLLFPSLQMQTWWFLVYVNALPIACTTHWPSLGRNRAPVGARFKLIKDHHC